MKVKDAETLKTKIGKEFTMICLMSKNTYRLAGVLKEVVTNKEGYDPYLVIKVTDYYNHKYPKDETYGIGKVQTIHLRKIVGIAEV